MNWAQFKDPVSHMHLIGVVVAMDPYEISIFLAQKPHERYQPAQRRYWGNIYIEKFANIGRSELH